MAQLPMYPAIIQSPDTTLAVAINETDTTISLVDASDIPLSGDGDGLFTIRTADNDLTPETIYFPEPPTANVFTGVTRGFEGVAKAFTIGAKVCRMLTHYDADTWSENIRDLALNSHSQYIPEISGDLNDVVGDGIYQCHIGCTNVPIAATASILLVASHFSDSRVAQYWYGQEGVRYYRIATWDGSNYVWQAWILLNNLALGELSTNAYRGDRGKTAYDHSQATHAPSDAEKNVNADWNAVTGDAEILNKPALSPSDAEKNVNADWNAVTGDAEILNKPALLALGETETTAYRGDRGKTAYDHSQVAHAPASAEENVQADWDASSGDALILNKPFVPKIKRVVLDTGTVTIPINSSYTFSIALGASDFTHGECVIQNNELATQLWARRDVGYYKFTTSVTDAQGMSHSLSTNMISLCVYYDRWEAGYAYRIDGVLSSTSWGDAIGVQLTSIRINGSNLDFVFRNLSTLYTTAIKLYITADVWRQE